MARPTLALCLCAATVSAAVTARDWTPEQARPILARTLTVHLAPDLSGLGSGERAALPHLLKLGAVMQDLYEASLHREALATRARLTREAKTALPGASERATLYRLFQGPIATTLENRREPFVAVEPAVPGRNVYPGDVTKDELDAWLAAHPEARDELLHTRTVVRRDTPGNRQADRAALARHPVLAALHPALAKRLAGVPVKGGFYAVPYAVAWADRMVAAHGHLEAAAAAVAHDDAELAGYLRHRGRDLLANDYEAGDASWVTGRFRSLNAQIGAYETYDDALHGVKAFHGLSLLVKDEPATKAVQSALGGLQELEESLPYAPHRRVRESVPVGVYDVVADFGQARGTNTATILPNEAAHARRYGRVILMRRNVLEHPELFALTDAAWKAVVAAPHQGELRPDGNLYRTLWHELGHYLGPDQDEKGRELDVALQENADAFEEMKADLVSLYLAPALRGRGYYDEARLRSVYASGIRRVLLNVKPRRDQPYQTMQLMQWNRFLQAGLLRFDAGSTTLSVDYDRYHAVVTDLLRDVLALQRAGDAAKARAFVDAHTTWDERHEAIAAAMRGQERYRYRLVRYAALGE